MPDNKGKEMNEQELQRWEARLKKAHQIISKRQSDATNQEERLKEKEDALIQQEQQFETQRRQLDNEANRLKEWEDELNRQKQELDDQRRQQFEEHEGKQEEIGKKWLKLQEEQLRLEKLEQDVNDLLKKIGQPRKPVAKKHKRKVAVYQFQTEKKLVEHIKEYIRNRGFYYSGDVIENFYTSLKSILSKNQGNVG